MINVRLPRRYGVRWLRLKSLNINNLFLMNRQDDVTGLKLSVQRRMFNAYTLIKTNINMSCLGWSEAFVPEKTACKVLWTVLYLHEILIYQAYLCELLYIHTLVVLMTHLTTCRNFSRGISTYCIQHCFILLPKETLSKPTDSDITPSQFPGGLRLSEILVMTLHTPKGEQSVWYNYSGDTSITF